ncbi:MAG: L-rhamnose isomerase [Armatimonadetes bacterium CG_4_8_14_3_um_filter_58_9]|nr:MAG: L-rhamnose isomerase [Armatimonadetes bacterium CG_4_8_14_3_um_filter_58_9]
MIPSLDSKAIEHNYTHAKESYAAFAVDADAALDRLAGIPISINCWQGDDVGGFENLGGELTGGIAATGNYPGKARTADELRGDLSKVYSLLAGKHRLNLHAIYADFDGEVVDRDAITPQHFAQWIAWAKEEGIGLDFNPSYFSHPRADDGWTLASRDKGTRDFWVQHGLACREIAAAMGIALGTMCTHNVWIPDGEKDLPADRWTPRELLRESLDRIFAVNLDPAHVKDAVEPKLFGIGSEAYVVGSYDFYLAYAIENKKMLCLDTGHFHPTEQIADKLSAVLTFLDDVLLHVSRGIRWDSDHVVILGDEVRALAEEIIRGDSTDRVFIGLDFFDASINRIAAWVIGARAMQKALLLALLQPTGMLKELEAADDRTARLAIMEDFKSMPLAAVWDFFCDTHGVPAGAAWLNDVRKYEEEVLSKRT